MPLEILRSDICTMAVDAVVNAANRRLVGGSGVNGAIHKGAGPLLPAACAALGGCETGQAKLTPGFDLPARYIIHTVGPIWQGGGCGERELLAACYRNSLALAKAEGLRSIAFPLISSGVFGYPKAQAMKVALDTIRDFLLDEEEDMTVYLLVYGRESLAVGEKLFSGIQQFIDDHYVDSHRDPFPRRRPASWEWGSVPMERAMPMAAPGAPAPKAMEAEILPAEASLAEELEGLDESFSQMVLRKIAEKGMKNSDCYKKANIDKKLFSKLSNDVHYKPRKTTALALAVALELPLEETKELLMKAGLALSRSEKFDVIVEYFLRKGNYDIFEINEALFFYDQALLGGAVY